MSNKKHEAWVNSLAPADLPKVAGILLAIVVAVRAKDAQGFSYQIRAKDGHTFTVVSRRSAQEAHRRLLIGAKRSIGKE